MKIHFLIDKKRGQLGCGLYITALDPISIFTKRKGKVNCWRCIRQMICNSKNKRINLNGTIHSIGYR